MTHHRLWRAILGGAAFAVVAPLSATPVLAQTMNANSAAFNAGYGRTAGSENSPVNPSMADANGNLVVVNGLLQAGASGSVFANASGAASAFSGVGGSASASAIGNNLNVVVQGNNNTVVVNSTQTNTGTVTATSSTNGNP